MVVGELAAGELVVCVGAALEVLALTPVLPVLALTPGNSESLQEAGI